MLVYGGKVVRKLVHTWAFAPFVDEAIQPVCKVKSDGELREYIRNNAGAIYHPVGTCKIGVDPLAMADPQLRVHGVAGLRVADASIMPTIINGNTNATGIMIGEKAADMIKAEYVMAEER